MITSAGATTNPHHVGAPQPGGKRCLMRQSLIAATFSAALLVPLALIGSPAQATNIGNEGCTPGYWKNHTENWFDDPAIPMDASSKTLAKAGFETTTHDGDLLLDALSYAGGPGAAGAERILLRAAAAAWLNAAHEGVGYPFRRFNDPGNFVAAVNDAIVSGNRATMLALATTLDNANNLGCPLN